MNKAQEERFVICGGSHVVLHSVKMGLGSNGGLRDIEGHKVGFNLLITTILEVRNDGCNFGHPW